MTEHLEIQHTTITEEIPIMSYYDYRQSEEINALHFPFYALIMAAMRQADSDNTVMLRANWPHVWDELQRRYLAPGGKFIEELEAEAEANLVQQERGE